VDCFIMIGRGLESGAENQQAWGSQCRENLRVQGYQNCFHGDGANTETDLANKQAKSGAPQ
jgi:hypothetical protein